MYLLSDDIVFVVGWSWDGRVLYIWLWLLDMVIGKFIMFSVLLSGGDNGYFGFVIYDNILFMSYYLLYVDN